MDTPNLFLVHSWEKDNNTVADQLFIEMICAFIQKNALCEVIFKQIPTLMVWKFYDQFISSVLLHVTQCFYIKTSSSEL